MIALPSAERLGDLRSPRGHILGVFVAVRASMRLLVGSASTHFSTLARGFGSGSTQPFLHFMFLRRWPHTLGRGAARTKRAACEARCLRALDGQRVRKRAGRLRTLVSCKEVNRDECPSRFHDHGPLCPARRQG